MIIKEIILSKEKLFCQINKYGCFICGETKFWLYFKLHTWISWKNNVTKKILPLKHLNIQVVVAEENKDKLKVKRKEQKGRRRFKIKHVELSVEGWSTQRN